MKEIELIKKLQGIHTIESVKKILKVQQQKAVYYIYRLRKKRYVRTLRTSQGRRVYNISFENKLGGVNPVEVINKYSPIKVIPVEDYQIYGKSPTAEEALVYAIASKNFRIILASISLFKKIRDWSKLYRLAKQRKIKRQIGALYDMTKKILKIRKMPKKFRKNCLPKKNEKYGYIMPDLKSDNFKDIEKTWRVYIPFNAADLTPYKK